MTYSFLIAVAVSYPLLAQMGEEPVVLTIDVENHVLYRGTVADSAQFGKTPGPVPAPAQIPFVSGINVGDIVAINGTPVRGIWSSSFTHTTAYRISPQPGQFEATADSGPPWSCTWQIWDRDGNFLGTLLDGGSAGGHAVSGALAGFFGATGVHTAVQVMPSRATSNAEDPANRRTLGGGKLTATYYLYPRARPSVAVSESGPMIFHEDFTPVSATNPARPGEVLIIGARGLGPVKPDVTIPPGAARFSDSPRQEVNSPVTVRFNGRELPVINKLGWPGQTTLYRVDFQVPSDTAPGMATLSLSAMWIPGPSVTMPIRN